MDRTAEGCAFIIRLISARLKPFSLVSSRLTSCVSMGLSKSQKQTRLINDKRKNPCNHSLVDGRGHCPGYTKLLLDRPNVATRGTYNRTKTNRNAAPDVENLSRKTRLNAVSSRCVVLSTRFTPGMMLNNILPERIPAFTNPLPMEVTSWINVVGCAGVACELPR